MKAASDRQEEGGRITAKQVKYLQTMRRKLGITDEDYAAMKEAVGASSTRDLNRQQMDELLRRMGVEPSRPVHSSARKSGMHRPVSEDKQPMVSKIGAILAEQKLPWSYADGVARSMFGVERLKWCNSEQTYKVLQALIMYQKRRKPKA